MVMEITCTQAGHAWFPAEAIVKEIELEIGGQKIDRHMADYFRVYDELFRSGEQKEAYKRMTNFDWASETAATGGVKRKLYLPLIFFFNKEPGQALPLIQLQFHECKLHLTVADWSAHLGLNQTEGVEIKLYANYTFLDVEERKRFASSSTESLIEQVQYNGEETKTNNIRLTFNHPVKYLAWVMTSSSVPKHGLYNMAAPTEYFGDAAAIAGASVESDQYNDAFAPIKTVKLQLNGHDRFSERPGKWFNQVVPFQACGTMPRAGVYMYSFALQPGKHQPSGTANFSRIDNATLNLTYKTVDLDAGNAAVVLDDSKYGVQWADVNATTDAFDTVRIWAVNYNVLRIVSGMGGLAFSN